MVAAHYPSPRPRGFVKLPTAILLHPDLSLQAKLLYGVLRRYARQRTYCLPGCARLAADLGRSENTMRKAMNDLVTAGLVTRRRRGFCKTNVYYLLDPNDLNEEIPEPQLSAALVPQRPAVKVEEEREREQEGFDSSIATSGSVSIEIPDSIPGGEHLPHVMVSPSRPAHSSSQCDPDRPTIRAVMEAVARETNDAAPLAATTTRAVRTFRRAGVSLDAFVDACDAARTVVKERTTSIRSVDVTTGRKQKAAYFFACLEDRLGLRERPGERVQTLKGSSCPSAPYPPATDHLTRREQARAAPMPGLARAWPPELINIGIPDLPTYISVCKRGLFYDPSASVEFARRRLGQVR